MTLHSDNAFVRPIENAVVDYDLFGYPVASDIGRRRGVRKTQWKQPEVPSIKRVTTSPERVAIEQPFHLPNWKPLALLVLMLALFVALDRYDWQVPEIGKISISGMPKQVYGSCLGLATLAFAVWYAGSLISAARANCAGVKLGKPVAHYSKRSQVLRGQFLVMAVSVPILVFAASVAQFGFGQAIEVWGTNNENQSEQAPAPIEKTVPSQPMVPPIDRETKPIATGTTPKIAVRKPKQQIDKKFPVERWIDWVDVQLKLLDKAISRQ